MKGAIRTIVLAAAMCALGSGPASASSASPPALSFGPQAVGTTSAPQTFILRSCEGGTGPGQPCVFYPGFSINLRSSSPDFNAVHSCPPTMGANQSCIVSVTFTPTADGTRSGILSTGNDGAGVPCCAVFPGPTVPLSGTGTATGSAKKKCKRKKGRGAGSAGKKKCRKKKRG